MVQITHGMNPEEVDALGLELQRMGDDLDRVLRQLDQQVNSTSWVGSDASRFKGQWWPSHRSQLSRAAGDLRGFGTSARNNASEQREASGVAGTPGAASTGGFVPGGGPAEPGVGGSVGSTSGSLAGSTRTAAEVDAAYRANATRFGLGAYGPGQAYEYQCTAWAEYRWRELGVEPSHDIGDGHGWQKAAMNGGSTSTPPSLGAMASYGNGQSGSYGHVMIVEEISAGPGGVQQLRVSEWNVGDSDYEVGRANEFRSDGVLTRNADGTWSKNGRNVGAVTFAGLPTS